METSTSELAADQYQTLGASVFFGPVNPDQLNRIHLLEAASYPEDEAATREKLDFRIHNAPNVFMVASQYRDGAADPTVVGYVCGTCTGAGRLTHESMATHDPDGDLLCIHSVVVEDALRRKGVATRMLRAYVSYVQATTPQLRGVRLICKDDLIGLYEKAGFRLVGPSDVVHGRDPWFEMALDLSGEAADEAAQPPSQQEQ